MPIVPLSLSVQYQLNPGTQFPQTGAGAPPCNGAPPAPPGKESLKYYHGLKQSGCGYASGNLNVQPVARNSGKDLCLVQGWTRFDRHGSIRDVEMVDLLMENHPARYGAVDF